MPGFDAKPDERGDVATSRSLLARLYADDPAAWDRLVTLYAPLVWSWCKKMHLANQDMADVIQEVFQAVATRHHTFRKDRPGDSFRGWLRTVTKNKVLDHFRRREQEPAAAGGTEAQRRWAELPEEPRDDEPLAPDERHLLFHRALGLIEAEFEARTWRAFWSVVVDGRCPKDVADDLGMTAGAVRVAKCRVLQRLRQELGEFDT